MTDSKAWNWNAAKEKIWLEPSEESYYLVNRWKAQGRKTILDLGCGLGRHSILFAKNGFSVSAMDLSQEGVNHLCEWAERENLQVNATTANMLSLPYADASFDCVFSFHVISHCDTEEIRKVISEIRRVLKPGGELYCTLCSKETWSFCKAGYPKIDENTVVKTDDGPEKGIPHFYVNLDDILRLFADFELLRIRHTDDCWFSGQKQDSRHYFITAQKLFPD